MTTTVHEIYINSAVENVMNNPTSKDTHIENLYNRVITALSPLATIKELEDEDLKEKIIFKIRQKL